MSGQVFDPEVVCFAQADIVLLTAGLFSKPQRFGGPDSRIRGGFLRELVEAAGGGADAKLLGSLEQALDETRRADRAIVTGEHTRLFEGPVACPINETAFVRRDKGMIIGDICGFYHAFGFEPDEASGEKADHLVCELEFVGILLVMLGEAHRARDAEKIAVVHAAIRAFLGEHLGDWLALFCGRLAGCTGLPVYTAGAELLGRLWDLLARQFDLPAFGLLDDERPEQSCDDDATPYECDMADAERQPELVELTGPAGSGLPQADTPGR